MYQLNLSVTDIVRTNHIPSPDFVVVSQVSKIRRRIIERGGGYYESNTRYVQVKLKYILNHESYNNDNIENKEGCYELCSMSLDVEYIL